VVEQLGPEGEVKAWVTLQDDLVVIVLLTGGQVTPDRILGAVRHHLKVQADDVASEQTLLPLNVRGCCERVWHGDCLLSKLAGLRPT
jgi:hypothetical protein